MIVLIIGTFIGTFFVPTTVPMIVLIIGTFIGTFFVPTTVPIFGRFIDKISV